MVGRLNPPVRRSRPLVQPEPQTGGTDNGEDETLTQAKTTKFGILKSRTHAVTAAAALAFLAGLTGPAAAAFADAPTTAASTTVQHSTVTGTATTVKKVDNPKPATPAKPATWANTAPGAKDLFTKGTAGGQSSFGIGAEEMKNARSIVETGQKLGLQPRAWVIALSTAMQESKLKNLGDLGAANDHDSLGLFQQRPASGWGSPEEINNPVYAATAFYKGLTGIGGWQNMSVTDAAQAVQVSAYPDAYAQWEKQAGDIISGLYGYGPYAQLAHQAK